MMSNDEKKTDEAGARVPTGISGLDDLTAGGFVEGSVNVVSGPAGSAKSLMSLQFVYNGAKDYGDTGVFITLEERRENILKAMSIYGMEPEQLEAQGKFYLIDMGKMRRLFGAKERLEQGLVDFKTLQEFLTSFIKTTQPKRLAIDSLVAAGLCYKSMEELREELFRFATFLQEQKITSILLTESVSETGDKCRYGMEDFIGDSFINLGLEKVKGELRRTITVRKMRFTKHDTSIHPFLILSSGIEISVDETVW